MQSQTKSTGRAPLKVQDKLEKRCLLWLSSWKIIKNNKFKIVLKIKLLKIIGILVSRFNFKS